MRRSLRLSDLVINGILVVQGVEKVGLLSSEGWNQGKLG